MPRDITRCFISYTISTYLHIFPLAASKQSDDACRYFLGVALELETIMSRFRRLIHDDKYADFAHTASLAAMPPSTAAFPAPLDICFIILFHLALRRER